MPELKDWDEIRRVMAEKWHGKVYGNQYGKFIRLKGNYEIYIHYWCSVGEMKIKDPRISIDEDWEYIWIEAENFVYRWHIVGKIRGHVFLTKDGRATSVHIKDDKNLMVIYYVGGWW